LLRIAFAILGSETCHLLVTGRGWPPARWQAWTLGALIHQLTQL
jgi:hypothetical protein